MSAKYLDFFPVRKDRTVFLNRTITLDLYNDLFPKICHLRDESSEPIYIYLDSLGGNVSYAEKIHELLKAPRHDGSTCDIVSIVPQLAASAAADLAILGDYSTIYPSALIYCHGTRISANELTVDNLGHFDATLRSENEHHALKLAKKVLGRLAFQIWLNRKNLDEFEIDTKDSGSAEGSFKLFSDTPLIERYFLYLLDKTKTQPVLSPIGANFVKRCLERWKRKSEIIELLAPKSPESGREDSSVARDLLEHIVASTGENSSLIEISRRMLNDAILLTEAFPDFGVSLDDLVDSKGIFFLSPEKESEFDELDDGEELDYLKRNVRTEVLLCSLFVNNLCQTLHEDENQFKAIDAYHIGLVDEIFGMSHIFPSFLSLATPDSTDSGE